MPAYNIPQECDNILDAMIYTVAVMKESGLQYEIEEYVNDAIGKSNFHLLKVTEEKLKECSNIVQVSDEYFNYGYEDQQWEDGYNSGLWDSDDENYYPNHKVKSYWEDESDEEAYEGFSSCKNHLWDSTDDDYFNDGRIVDYYDNMKREDDLEPSYDQFNDSSNDEDDDF